MKLTKLVVILAAMISSTFTAKSFAAVAIGKIVGQIGMAEGEVFVDNKPVSKRAPVREGSVVEIKDGKATLLLGTGSVFHLAANSKMTVKEFGMRSDTKKEGGDVALSFGRTRALILNKGSETKDVRIITRTATMGVRGTEVFVDVPKNLDSPVQFFTLEGLANVAPIKAPVVEVKQNTGVAASGATSAGGASQAGASTMTVAEVKSEIAKSGMQVASINTPGDMKRAGGEYHTDELPRIPAPRFDPLQDRFSPVNISASFCNATGSGTCP